MSLEDFFDGVRVEAIPLDALLRMEMPPRRWIIEGLMQERDIAEVTAWRGVGKTRFTHGLAVATATGCPFLRFNVPEPRGVLLVDGELPREHLQEMLSQAVAAAQGEPCAPLRILSSDLSEKPLPSLASEEGQRIVERNLADVDLLILDSVSTLFTGTGKENEAGSWDAVQEWLLQLRRQDVSVLFVHHDGKGGKQRGTSKREDILSQVVQLVRPSGYALSEGCRFEVHFRKTRGLVGAATTPFEATFSSEGEPEWTWTDLQDTRALRAAELRQEGLSQREIAEEMGCGLGTVNRLLRRADGSAVPPVPPPQRKGTEHRT